MDRIGWKIRAIMKGEQHGTANTKSFLRVVLFGNLWRIRKELRECCGKDLLFSNGGIQCTNRSSVYCVACVCQDVDV